MRRLISFLSIIIIFNPTLAVKASANNTTTHHERPKEHLVGAINKATLLEVPHRSWYEKGYLSYLPDESSIEALTEILDDIQVKVFMGTWCHDSQREVPRVYKILESSNFDLSRLDLVSLNPTKTTPEGLEKGFDIRRTPTFIFYKGGVELGRIVERPRESLENDILKIVSGQEYKHFYQD